MEKICHRRYANKNVAETMVFIPTKITALFKDDEWHCVEWNESENKWYFDGTFVA